MLDKLISFIKVHAGRLLIFIALGACVSPIDIDIQNAANIVVVAGQVSNLPDQCYVQIGLTSDKNQVPSPASHARAWIIDETAHDSIAIYESSTTAGLYLPLHYEGIPGHAYHIQVELPDRGSYTSDSEVMPAIPGTVTSHHEFKTQQYVDHEGIVAEEPFILIYADAQLPEGEQEPYV